MSVSELRNNDVLPGEDDWAENDARFELDVMRRQFGIVKVLEWLAEDEKMHAESEAGEIAHEHAADIQEGFQPTAEQAQAVRDEVAHIIALGEALDATLMQAAEMCKALHETPSENRLPIIGVRRMKSK
jgi:hypothetical protein